jgi:hypothetical protein
LIARLRQLGQETYVLGPAERGLLLATIDGLCKALAPFVFPAYPEGFASDDGGCTETILPDEDVQRGRRALGFDPAETGPVPDASKHRLSGKVCTRSHGHEIVWNDHLCEGANLTPAHQDSFVLWTRCGAHDVPHDEAHESDISDVTCEACLAIWRGEQEQLRSTR